MTQFAAGALDLAHLDERIHVARVVVGPLRTNCYVVSAADQAMVIDPGADAAVVTDALVELGRPSVAAIVLTHAHWDHVQAVDQLRDKLDAPVAARLGEAVVWNHELDHLRTHGDWDWAQAHHVRRDPPADLPAVGWDGVIDLNLETTSLPPIGGGEVHVLYTPGHTPGSVSLWVGGAVLTGDTLFPGGPGLTGWPLSDFGTIIDSISAVLFSLPDDVRVLPGHGQATRIGTERPHLKEWQARGW